MFTYAGKTALITGASSGIGKAFAHALAGKGMNLILVARRESHLQSLALELTGRYGIRVEIIPADLSKEMAAQTVLQEVELRGMGVDLLVNNAGFATHGTFESITPERDHQQVMVDVAAVVDMAHVFIPGMLVRGGGAIINIASTVSFQPVPYMAVYGASKAFVLSFSQALAEEYQKKGIQVLALCPGATATEFFEVAGGEDIAFGRLRTAEQVVATGLRALERGRRVVVDGVANNLVAQLPRILPRIAITKVAGMISKPKPEASATPVAVPQTSK